MRKNTNLSVSALTSVPGLEDELIISAWVYKYAQVVERGLYSLLKMPGIWFYRARARRELAMMDVRTIKDVGLSKAEIADEASKPFWMK